MAGFYKNTELEFGVSVVTNNAYGTYWETHILIRYGCVSASVRFSEEGAKEDHESAVRYVSELLGRPLEDMPLLVNSGDTLIKYLAQGRLSWKG